MGIESREYYRDDRPSGPASWMSETPSCRRILIATIAVFLLQIFVTRTVTIRDLDWRGSQIPDALVEEMSREGIPGFASAKVSVAEEWLKLDTDKVMHGQVWRLVSCAFLHDRFGLWHIAFNMILLVWFGRSLEAHYGSREFMLFYFVAIVVASLAFCGIQLATGARTPAIGASGAVMAVICLFTMWNPGYTVRLYFLFPIPMSWLLLLYVAYDLHPVLMSLAGTPTYTGIAHAAHLGGLAMGYLYYRNSWHFEPIVDFLLPSAKRRPAISPSRPIEEAPSPMDSLDHEVDRILAKISIEGETALTDHERRVLQQASVRYRKRG